MDLYVGWDIFFTSGAFLHVCLANYALHTNKRGNSDVAAAAAAVAAAMYGYFLAAADDGLKIQGTANKGQ